ncbi:MAG: translation initiation factor IF-2 [Pirellulales bacterium]|nr:translation initiation factor IF-2 [Pirellulales bacterium]
MALRIYSLAKELNVDSKDLVDICAKAGVTGKGSALASLTDDEVVKLKAYLAGASGPARAPARPAAPTAPAPAPGGSAPTSTIAAPTRSTVVRREDYIAPMGTAGTRPPVLGTKPEKPTGEAKKKPPAEPRSAPAIKLAPMPTAPQPTATSGPAEPAPQKPDIKLPADAIRAGKSGGKPLSEHLRKHEQRRKTDVPADAPAERPAPGRGGAPARPQTPAAPTAPGAARGGRRGREAAPAEEGEGGAFTALGGREQRQLKRKRVGTTARKPGEEEDDRSSRTARRRIRRTGTNTAAPRKSMAVLEMPCSVRSFSEELGVPARLVLGKLLTLGFMTNINAQLDLDTAELLAAELGVAVEFRQAATLEDELLVGIAEGEDAPELLEPRAPVVTFLGHVDHGKTSLLDRIIGIDVAKGESGGITQHIRAYRIDREGGPITFVDTPGHEAFTEMRARGANVTDIAVLVVAADDGVMPQTEEAISHARAAGVPIVVALNKIDLPGVNLDRIMQQLSVNELLPTEWGGDIEVVKCSALTGDGVDDLLETLLTIAELHEYKANPQRAAYGTCLEAELHEGRGVVAKMLVQKGTLKVGDVLVCGTAQGRVKAMYDTLQPGVMHTEAGPSMPVNVTGLDEAPAAGEHFYVLDDVAAAREIATRRSEQARQSALSGTPQHVTLETLFDRLGGSDVQTLNLILRADVRGSIEAIRKELTKLEHPEVQIKILQATVGGVSEADVHLADASDAIIIGFNVVPDEGARTLAERKGVQIRRYDIIYQVTDDLKAALEGMLKPERRDVDTGRAVVLQTFAISRVGVIAGCRVLSGTIERNNRIRLIRENRIVGDYALDSLRREKDDAREVREGFECGIRLTNYNDVKVGDVFEAYKVEEVARTL